MLITEADGALADRVVGQAVAATLHCTLISPVPGPDRVHDEVTAHGTVQYAEGIPAALDVLMAAFPRPAGGGRTAARRIRAAADDRHPPPPRRRTRRPRRLRRGFG